MRNSIIMLLFLFLSIISSAQVNSIIKDEKGNSILLGKVSRDILNHKDFDWFLENYNSYLINDRIVERLKDKLKGYKFKVFFGSWCGDSKRNLPVFYKVIEEAGFSEENIETIAVDRKKEAYKQAPDREEKGLNIHRVPTFILYKNGKEVNRIVEYPKETFERDLLRIMSGKKYRSKYKAVSTVSKILNKPKDSILLLKNELISFLPEIAEGVKELNTYGFVKLRAQEYEEAEFIFELNTKMYPNHYVPYNSLGVFYYERKQFNKALLNLYKSLSLQPNNENIKKIIEKINNKK